MQQALVSRELLERTDATRRPNNRDEVARLDLRVDVLVDGIPHVEHALEREAEIVDDERDRARDFVGRGRGRPQRAGGRRLRPRLRGRIAAAGRRSPRSGPRLRLILRADVERLLQRLVPAADGDVEVVARQIRDQLSVAIRHDGIDGDEMRGRAKDGCILGAELMLRRQRGTGDEQGAEKAEATSHTRLPSSVVADRRRIGRFYSVTWRAVRSCAAQYRWFRVAESGRPGVAPRCHPIICSRWHARVTGMVAFRDGSYTRTAGAMAEKAPDVLASVWRATCGRSSHKQSSF